MNQQPKHTNRLIHETSPYLLQHAHNPVDWYAWNSETLHKAKEQDKMLLISVGYSSCHWCHVMAHESFENERVAKIMNEHFICVKVDREERPDVDAVYMNAVQLIHGSGGWPLNCFALPDGKPVYGGTYFRPLQWEALLKNIADLYLKKRPELEEQARQILEGIHQDNLVKIDEAGQGLNKTILENAINKWQRNFDREHGGAKGAPKFPLPSNYLFLLEYAHAEKRDDLMNFVELTLDKMAMGGIYDQVGGGFSRYSVDASWKVPHFEKMLYDNAQMVTIYTRAFQLTGKDRFLATARETADFVLRELTAPEGAFYSALDADSEGEEGKYYVWTKSEFDATLGDDSDLIGEYFNLNGEALWEHGKNVLMRTMHPGEFAKQKNLDQDEFLKTLDIARQKLLDIREKRTRPGLDDKSLTSWNALMIKALVQLSGISGETKYLDAALKASELIKEKLMTDDGTLLHSYKNGKSSITGFLEDYAFAADAAIEFYQVSMDERWIRFARELTDFAVDNFYDREDQLFWFTSGNAGDLVARKKEFYDNVIPASNSVMAHVLFKLSKFYGDGEYAAIAQSMAERTGAYVQKFPTSFSNWARLIFYLTGNFFEVVVAGPEAKSRLKKLYRYPWPAKITAGAESESGLPVFDSRFQDRKTMIYICSGNVCRKPVEDLQEATDQLV